MPELVTSAAVHYLYEVNIVTELGSKEDKILALKEKILTLHGHMLTAIGGTSGRCSLYILWVK